MAALFRRVRADPGLRRICDLAGRFRRVAQSKQRLKTGHGLDDVVGVEPGGDVGRLLPSELAKLMVPELELDALRRVVEGQALCREHHAVEPVGKGPVIVCVDESGSMSGEKVHTAKALALALAWVARSQRRWCGLVAYSGDSGERLLALPPGRWDEGRLDGIPPAPQGTPQVEVSFELDANGVLSVSAKDLGTQKQQSIRIEASSGMTKGEVDRMKRDAEQNAEEDKRRREFAEARNAAENRIHAVERTLAGAGGAMTAADRAPIDRATAKVREAVGGTDVAGLKRATDELEQAAAALAQHLSATAGKRPGGPDGGHVEPAPSAPRADREDVIDAEYEVKG